MRILCAPDSFKESIGAIEAAEAMAEGARGARGATIAIDRCPVADGGEGSLEVLAGPLGAEIHAFTVHGPRGDSISGRVAVSAKTGTGVVQLADASGLAALDPSERDPTRTSTYGTGELIAHALRLGAREVLVCIGGSATIDGGTGLAQALGVEFLDRNGDPMEDPITGGMLSRIAAVRSMRELPIRVACDVLNPLTGPRGAAQVYGPQKGATPEQVARLEAGLENLARVAGGNPDEVGAGAAGGGAGYGLHRWLGAKLVRGIDLILDTVGFDDRCRNADLVLSGEGRLDGQSREGKAVIGVSRAAASHGVPTHAIVGDVGPGAEACLREHTAGGLAGYLSLTDRFGRAEALADPSRCITAATTELVGKIAREA